MEAIKPDRQVHERDCTVRYTRDTDSLVINYESEREFEILKKYLGSRLNGANFWKHDKQEQCVLIPLEYNFSTSQIIDGMKIVELTDRAERAEAILEDQFMRFYGNDFKLDLGWCTHDLNKFFETHNWFDIMKERSGQIVKAT